MTKRMVGISYIKVLLTMYVVMHHAILAYLPGGPGVRVDDPNNFEPWYVLVTYFDQFFMYAFFFIAGLFAYRSIQRRGAGNYVLSRVIKYGLIFLFGTYLFNSTMLYFKEVTVGTEWWVQYASLETYFNYLRDLNSLFHPALHLWFLWLLVFFHIIFALLYKTVPKLFEKEYDLKTSSKVIAITIVIMMVGYAVVGIIFGFGFIQLYGPFTLQISRIIPYFTLFFLGILIGKQGINNTFLSPVSEFGQKWKTWLLVGIISSVLFYLLATFVFEDMGALELVLPMISALYGALAYTVIGLRWKKKMPFFDFLVPLVFTIYVVHYGLQAVIHAFFLDVNISGFVEGIFVFILTMIVSIGVALLVKYMNPLRYVKKT